jgi:nickel-dependent lactate racemase
VRSQSIGLLGDAMKLPYGRRHVTVDLTRYLKVKTFTPPEPEATGQLESMIRASLAGPIGSPSLCDVARSARSAVIAIPDRTRPPVAAEVLSVVLDELQRGGLDPGRISVFVSTGTHAEHSSEDLENLVGEAGTGLAVYQNRSDRIEDFEDLGTTVRGTPILINRKILEADLKVVIGPIAYHYFAGWGGGRKMLVPGAAHIETACANHRLTIDDRGGFHPGCRNGVLDGNPVHEDMIEAARTVPGVFAVNVLLDGWARIAGVVSGDLIESHLTSVEAARPLLEVRTGGRCDLAIASAGGYPFDLNFVQAHKTIDHAAGCVGDGGVVIAIAECTDGLGSNDLLSWFELGDVESVSKRLLWQYRIHGHTALSLMKKLERVRVILVSSLPGTVVESLGMLAAGNTDTALMMADRFLGEKGLTYVFPCAWGILPVA